MLVRAANADVRNRSKISGGSVESSGFFADTIRDHTYSVINKVTGGSNLILNRYHRAIGDYDNLALDLILGVSIRFNFSTSLQIFMEIHIFFRNIIKR